jgi:hypothetical protein
MCTGIYKDRQSKIDFCKMLKNMFPDLSGRDISRITKLPITSVSRYPTDISEFYQLCFWIDPVF